MDDITKQITKDIEKATGLKLDSLVDLVLTQGLNLLGAIAIFVIGRFVAKRLSKLLKKALQRAHVDKTLVSFFANILYFTLLAFVLIAAVGQVGVQTTSFAAAIAAAGLAVGLALQGSLSNFAAGVLIIIFRPFRAGDYVEVAGLAGEVDEISIFTTTLLTVDNKKIIVPNSQVTNTSIVNYSANPTRRVDMVFSAGYDDDVRKVRAVLEKIVEAEPRVLKKPAAQVAVADLGESSISYHVRPWVKTNDYWDVKWAITEQVKIEFDKAGFSIPFPQRDVHIYNEVATPKKSKPAKKLAAKKKAVKKK